MISISLSKETPIFEQLSDLATSSYIEHVQPALLEKLEKTSVVVLPRTSQRVRERLHNPLKSYMKGRNKIPFDSIEQVKTKFKDGIPYTVDANGKLDSFQMESDTVGGDYRNSVLVPRILNILIKDTKATNGILTIQGVKFDVRQLSLYERQLFCWLVKLNCMDAIVHYYFEHLQLDCYYIFAEHCLKKIDYYQSMSNILLNPSIENAYSVADA